MAKMEPRVEVIFGKVSQQSCPIQIQNLVGGERRGQFNIMGVGRGGGVAGPWQSKFKMRNHFSFLSSRNYNYLDKIFKCFLELDDTCTFTHALYSPGLKPFF